MSDIRDEAAIRALLRRTFDTAVAAADPMKVLARHLPERPKGRVVVIGAGKASALMAKAVVEHWPDAEGLVVTRYDHAVPAGRIEIVEASHPVPDANGEAAARRILDKVKGLGPDDLVLALISGGGSALLSLPAEGLTLADKQAVNRALLASGAAINEMNAVRKHLSAIKGGQLARAAAPAKVVTLTISDVPGDDPTVIASGPTVPDNSTIEDVRRIIKHYGIELPPAVAAHLAKGHETPKPGAFPVDIRMIATPAMALAAAADFLRNQGITPLILGDALEGESRELGNFLAGIAKSARQHGLPLKSPCALLSGGETTVSIGKGPAGRGGRNTECLLALAVALGGAERIWAVAGDTDGIDGTEDAAGAIIGPHTLATARAKGLDPRAYLAGHDSYSLFDAIGDLVKTGPTLTNVNDFRAVFVL
ncbi:MAG TPA: glycerate kinase [Stellaceae bacterium]|nr:glycerate kinase [Stellaceae bacterium]